MLHSAIPLTWKPVLRWSLLAWGLCACLASPVAFGQDVETVRPLLRYAEVRPASVVPAETLFLVQPAEIEGFLQALEGEPPDWARIYGDGDEAHMDRLFDENRRRDRARQGNPVLDRRVAFVWEGVVTGYDAQAKGFRLAIGPKVIATRWGQVRFKPEGLPSGLVAVPPPDLAAHLMERRAKRETVDIDLVLTGRLLPEESVIYDFSHEEKGQGMLMPVVRIEQIDYFLAEPS